MGFKKYIVDNILGGGGGEGVPVVSPLNPPLSKAYYIHSIINCINKEKR